MRVISNKILLAFSALHPQSTKALQLWRKAVEAKSYPNFAALKAVFGAIDKAGDFYIFDLGGNKYRLIAAVHFNRQILFIRHVFTHKQYDRWRPQ